MQNTTGRLLLIILVSILVKRELANEAVNYDTEAKAYVMSSRQRVFREIVFLEISKIHRKIPGPVCNFIKKEALAQVFSCEFCQISKNTFSYRTPLVAALYVTIWARSIFGQVSEAVLHRFSSKKVFSKISEKHLFWRHFLIKLQFWRLY